MEYGIISSGIRNHMDENENSALEREEEKRRRAHQQVKVLKFQTFDGDYDDDGDTNCLRMSERDLGSELALKQQERDQEPGNYVLRENPKKTKRFVDSKELKVCRECGKGFQSLKALCGHMASHSEKERVRSKFKEEKAAMDGRSDTESSGPKRRSKRRVRIRNVGGSVAELEQQEVAISLMLLSRDCGYNKLGLNSVAESSSNNSVVLEAKSSSMDVIISAKRREAKIVAKKDVRSLSKPGAETGDSENSDSGYFRNGPKKNESDVSVEFKKLEAESGGNGLGMSELGKRLVGAGEEGKEDQEIRGSSNYELRKRAKNGNHKTEPVSGYHHYLDESDHALQKKSKYECSTCNKAFASHTALGGHRASHAKANGCSGSICESGENSIETDTGKTPKIPKTPAANAERKLGSKKSKGHECPICFRMFKSGQALGGHKRSHFVGGREANSTTFIMQEEPTPEPEITILFDLNLPAPMEEEEADEDVGFMEW